MKTKWFTIVIFILFFLKAVTSFASKVTYYKENGHGPALVLIHAFPTDHRLWEPQLTSLSAYFRVIVLDLKGFGKSEKTNGQAVTMTEYADQVKALLDQLHIKKAIIGGESMGGYVALAFLKKYPEKTAGLILSNTNSIADSKQIKINRETTAQDVLQNGTQTLINNFIAKALSPKASDKTRSNLLVILKQQSPAGIASAARGMALREDNADLLTKTNVPILILSGQEDILLLPEQSKTMQALAKNSKLIILDHAGHLSNIEQPNAWNKAVIDFFKQ